MWTIPNILTILRICSFPFLIWLILQERFVGAFILIVAAGLTDLLDGVIARAFNQQSDVGKILDPLADKLLSTTLYTAFSLKGVVPPWLGALVIGRDVIISLGALVLVLLDMKVTISPSTLGKQTTGIQVVAVALALLSVLPYVGPFVQAPGAIEIAFYTTGVFTLASGIDYISRNLKEYEKGMFLKDVYRPVGDNA